MEVCVQDILTFSGWWKQSRRIEIDMESGKEGRDVGEVRNRERRGFIIVKHNIITAVVETHWSQTHSSSVRRRPRWVWQRARCFQISPLLPWSRNYFQRGLQVQAERKKWRERERNGETERKRNTKVVKMRERYIMYELANHIIKMLFRTGHLYTCQTMRWADKAVKSTKETAGL